MSDLTAPTLVSATPSLNTSAVSTGADIVLTFSEAMAAGTGLITITDGATQTYMGKDGAMHTRIVGATDTRTVSITDTSQVTVSGDTVTINLTQDLQSGKIYSVQMGKGVLLDTAGNGYAGLADTTKLHFTTAAVTIPGALVGSAIAMTDTGGSSTDFITKSAAQTVSGTYTGTLAAGDFVEVSLDSGATWITASAADHAWSATGAIAASGTVIARVSNAENGHSLAARQAFTYDADAPTVASFTMSDKVLVAGETSAVTITFNEAVSGLELSDFTVTGGALSNLASADSGKTWTATLTPTINVANGAGQITLASGSVSDTAGNSGPASDDSQAFSYSTVPDTPTATIATVSMTDTGASASDFITNATAQTISGTYTGALASGEYIEVSLDDGATWTEATLGDTSWSLAGQTISASSTLQVRVTNGYTFGNALSQSYTLDQAAPAATVAVGDSTLVLGQTTTVTVTFSEAVSGLTSDDFTVTGGSIGTPSTSDGGTTWTATLTPSTHGSGSVQLNTSTVTDTAGNSGPTSSASTSFTYDSTPTVTIASASMTDTGSSSSDFITKSTSQTLSGTISAALSSNEKVQVSLDNGNTWTNAATSGTSWSLEGQTISASSTFKVRVSNGTVSGTEYSHSYTLDRAPATAAVTMDDSTLTLGQTTTVTVTFSKAVSGLTSDDFTVTGGSIGTPSTSDGGTTWTATLTPSTHGSGSVQLNTSTVTDTAGNSGPTSSASTSFTYDSTPTVTIASASMTDTGSSNSDFITDSMSQTLSGTISAALSSNEKVQVSLDNGSTWINAATSGTSWSLTDQAITYSNTLKVRVSNGTVSGAEYSHAYTLDQAAPTATVAVGDSSLTTGETTTVTVTFSEAVSGLTSSDFTVTGGSIGTPSSSDGGTTWTATLTPSVNGKGSVQLNTSTVTDTAGNSGPSSSASTEFSYDTTPTVTIATAALSSDTGTSSSDFITNTAAQTVSGTLSTALLSGEKVQVSLNNGSTWTDAVTSGTGWSLSSQTFSASNTLKVRVANGTTYGTVYSHSYTLDQTAPTAAVSLDDTSLTSGQTGTVTVKFNEAVSGLASSDFTVTGGSIGTPSSSDGGTTWTATLTPSSNGSGSVQLNTATVSDTAGNSGPSSSASASFTYDSTPAAAIATAAFSNDNGKSSSDFITNATSQTVSGTYSGSLATGDKVQVSLDGGTTWTNATAASGSWSLSGQTLSASNTLEVRVANGTTYSEVYSHAYTLDQSAPTATVSVANASLTTGDTTTVTITFSEAVSGLTSSDFTVTGGSIGSLVSSESGTTWTATLTPSTKGSGSVQLNSATIIDTAGNSGPSASASASFTYTPAPTVTVSTAAFSSDNGASSSDFITNATSQTISGTLSASLASDEKVQVSLDDGSSWTDATTSGASWSLAGQTLSASDTLVVRVSNGTYHGTEYSQAYTLDQTAPTASIELGSESMSTGQTTTVTVTFDEAVSGLASSDFTVTGGSIGTPSSSDGGTTWTATLTPSSNGSGSVQLNTSTVTDTAGNSGPSSSASASFTYDSTPTATIATAAFSSDTGSSASDFITSDTTQTITGTLSAALATGESVQVSLDNGDTWTEASTSGTSWSLARQTLSASNTMEVRVSNGTAHGTAYSQAYILDQSAPTVSSLSLNDTTLGSGQTGTLTVVFNEKVIGLTSSDFTVSGGTLGTMSSSDGITWTGTLTPTESGNVTFAAGSVTDVAGNSGPSAAPSSLSYSYSTAALTATLALSDNKLTTGETATLTVTLSTAVTDTPAASDFTVTGGSLGTFTSTDGGTTWTATLTPTSSAAGAGSVTLSASSISDPYGNAGPSSSVPLSFDYDTQTPALTSNTIAFSSDTGAYSNDLITQTASQTISGSFTGTVYSATGAKIEVSADNGETWTTATVDNTTHTWSASKTLSGSSTIQVKLTDSSGTASTQSHSYTIDTTAPTLSSSSPSSSASGVSASSGITLTFSEAMYVNNNVSFELTNASNSGDTRDFVFESTSGNLSSYSDSAHSITLTPASNLLTDGSYTLAFTGGTLTDLAGNTFKDAGTSVLTFSTESGNLVVVDPIATPDPVTLALTETTYASHTGTDDDDGYTSNTTLLVSGITESHLKYSLDSGSSWTTVSDLSGSTYSITLEDGIYDAGSIQVEQYTSTDYVSSATQTSKSWTIDTSAPVLWINSASTYTGGVSAGVDITIGWDGEVSTDDDVIEYSTDGSTWTKASSLAWDSATLSSVVVAAGGEVAVRVTDKAGNAGTYNDSTYVAYFGDSTAATHTATGGKHLFLQSADDTVNISGDDNVIYASDGANTLNITGGSGNSVVGGTDVDTVSITGTSSSSSVYTFAGNDIITMGSSVTATTIDAGAGDDTIAISSTSNFSTIDAGADTDTIKFNVSASLSSLVDKVTNIEKLYVSSGNTLTIDSNVTKADLVAMGFSTATPLLQTYAVVKVDGDYTGHLSLGAGFIYNNSLSEVVLALGSSVTSGYYTYVDSADSIIVLVGTSFIAS